MRITIDTDLCAGHGACADTCPEVFAIGPSGYAEVVLDEIPDELQDLVRRAEDECPTLAIAIEADDQASA